MRKIRAGFTLYELETSDLIVAKVWRAIRARGEPVAINELCRATESWRNAARQLVRYGWLRVERKRAKEMLYTALSEPERQEHSPLRTRVTNAKRRLTVCAAKASEARRSALARTMAQTLFELEKDLREIRESLGGGG